MLAKQQEGIRGRELAQLPNAEFVPFTAQTRMSGVNLDGQEYRKGAADSVRAYVGGKFSPEIDAAVTSISSKGGTPLVVATKEKALGSSTSRTSSKVGWRIVSSGSAPWASRRS